MILTRSDFFDVAVDILYKKGNVQNLSYIDSIEFARNKLGITNQDLKRLLSTGVNEIYVNENKKH